MLAFLLLACTDPADSAAEAPAPELHGRVDHTWDREVLYLWGTREEMGYAEGSLYCDRVGPLFRDYLLDGLVANYSDYDYGIVRAYVLSGIKYEDGDLAEITAMYQGMLDHCSVEQLTVETPNLEPDSGGKRMLELDDLLFANAVADYGCSSFTVWGAASATGDTIHGRNFDWATDDKGAFLDNHMVKVYRSDDEGGAEWASVFVPGMVGCISCVTEEGVALTMHNVGGLEPRSHSNISPRMLAARAAVTATWKADDVVSAAENALEPRRQLEGNNLHLSFPMARGHGIGGVVFEYDGGDSPDGQVTVRYPGDDPDLPVSDAIVATNHYIDRSPPDTEGDSFERISKLHAAVLADSQTGGVDDAGGLGMLQSVERDHDGVTVHSVLIDSANRSLQLFVAPDPATAAPLATGVTYDLDELFAGLPAE